MVVDPIVVAAGTGLLASVAVGKGLAYGLESVPQRWRRTSVWLLVAGAGLVAIVADLWSNRPGPDGFFVFVVAALPGIVAYLAFRTVLASALVSLLPLYYGIGEFTTGRTLHMPAIALDRALSVQPAWMLVYGSLYVFVLLPLLVVRDQQLFRRALKAYLTVLIVAYAGFLAYPTIAPRPATLPAAGFTAWCLRLIYALDSPYNCFPSLHVAHSFVSALACYRVNKRVGFATAVWASLIGVSTLFTKQHFAVDVIAGALVAYTAYGVFLRSYPRELVPAVDRHLAPRRAAAVIAIYGILVASFWVLYTRQLVSF